MGGRSIAFARCTDLCDVQTSLSIAVASVLEVATVKGGPLVAVDLQIDISSRLL